MPDVDADNFATILAANPDYLQSLQRSANLSDFKDTYKVSRASGLRCPACPGQYGGSLWIGDNPLEFTCRKCRLSFQLTCHQMTNDALMTIVKKVKKGEALPPRGDIPQGGNQDDDTTN